MSKLKVIYWYLWKIDWNTLEWPVHPAEHLLHCWYNAIRGPYPALYSFLASVKGQGRYDLENFLRVEILVLVVWKKVVNVRNWQCTWHMSPMYEDDARIFLFWPWPWGQGQISYVLNTFLHTDLLAQIQFCFNDQSRYVLSRSVSKLLYWYLCKIDWNTLEWPVHSMLLINAIRGQVLTRFCPCQRRSLWPW